MVQKVFLHLKTFQKWLAKSASRVGQVKILGKNAQGFPVVKFEGVTGTNVNAGVGITGQPTNVFIIKGTKSPSIVPANPNWTQK